MEKFLEYIKEDKEIMKNLKSQRYYDLESFYQDCETFVYHTKDRRMFCIIRSVSRSGISRVMDFRSPINHGDGSWGFRGWYQFMNTLGYRESKSDRGFVISGCGMDMVFHTHYTIIHRLCKFGFITKGECDKLAQMTPTII